ncbi:MAG: hypothetical protein ABIE36_00580 [Candidatus Diapherotrites archaeon]
MAEKEKTKEEEKPSLSYDWNLLGYAKIAEEYLRQGREGIPFAKKSLELILNDIKTEDPWIVKTVTDPEVLRKTIKNQLDTYSQCKEKQTIGDLLAYHGNDLSKYLGDNLKVANEELGKFAKEKYSDIVKKIKEANHTIMGKELGKNSDEQAEEAEKVKEQYQKVTTPFDLIEGLYFGRFRTRVEEEVTKDVLNSLFSPEEESRSKEKGKRNGGER